jgi:spore maturation protein SpmA
VLFRLLIALGAMVGAFFLLILGWVSIMRQEEQSGKLLPLAQTVNPLLLKFAGSPLGSRYFPFLLSNMSGGAAVEPM